MPESLLEKSVGEKPQGSTKYLVKDKSGNGHLPYTDASGKISPGRLGAAWAALHGGYRGSKYEGPNKQAAIAKLKSIYRRMGKRPPGANEMFIGPFTKFLTEMKAQFDNRGYAPEEVECISRTALLKPLPVELTSKSAAWMEEWLPKAQVMLEDEWSDLSRRVGMAAQMSGQFRDSDDPIFNPVYVCGVYPGAGTGAGKPGMVVVREYGPNGEVGAYFDTDLWAADWEEDENGDIKFANVRSMNIMWEMESKRIARNLGEALVIVEELLQRPIDAELSYLTRRIIGSEQQIPAITLNRRTDMSEMEVVKYLRNTAQLDGTIATETLNAAPIKNTMAGAEAVVAISEAGYRKADLQRRTLRAQKSVIRPTVGMSMSVGEQDSVAADIQMIAFSTEHFTEAEATAWAKRHHFKTDQMAKTGFAYEFKQFESRNGQAGTFALANLTVGVAGVICAER